MDRALKRSLIGTIHWRMEGAGEGGGNENPGPEMDTLNATTVHKTASSVVFYPSQQLSLIWFLRCVKRHLPQVSSGSMSKLLSLVLS